MCVQNLPSTLVKIDRFLDFIPGLSTVANLVNLIAKAILSCPCLRDCNNDWARHLSKKSVMSCIGLALPGVNVIIAICRSCFAANEAPSSTQSCESQNKPDQPSTEETSPQNPVNPIVDSPVQEETQDQPFTEETFPQNPPEPKVDSPDQAKPAEQMKPSAEIPVNKRKLILAFIGMTNDVIAMSGIQSLEYKCNCIRLGIFIPYRNQYNRDKEVNRNVLQLIYSCLINQKYPDLPVNPSPQVMHEFLITEAAKKDAERENVTVI